jgi:hypothetical protein
VIVGPQVELNGQNPVVRLPAGVYITAAAFSVAVLAAFSVVGNFETESTQIWPVAPGETEVLKVETPPL